MAGDAVNTYLLGGAPSARFARRELKGYLRALPTARHFVATRDADAVALWQLLPRETPANELLAGWTRIFRVPLKLWPAAVALELRYEAAHAAAAAAAPGGAYYYLAFVGTAPAARGRGLASALLAHMTARADAEGRPCLLEATSGRSAGLYARHGFVTYEVFTVAPGAPPVFFMRRDPRPPAAAAAAEGAGRAAAAPHIPAGAGGPIPCAAPAGVVA
ncbi:MAG: hypothetical protein J3K34DRAFT_425233 [Monoraphidium minutum]|nr:MAG: hypothetical protein J3K34DRAFT_425233 [Monoraphidium minutum]